MNNSKYKFSLYIISVVILTTIGIQVYWNYKNYLSNKTQLITDVQVSLDNAVSEYYSNLAEKSTHKFSFKESEINEQIIVNHDTIYDRVLGDVNFVEYDTVLDSIGTDDIENITVLKNVKADTIIKLDINGNLTSEEWIGDHKMIKTIKHVSMDSLTKKDFEMLTAQVMLKISNDTINTTRIKELLDEELRRKNIDITYELISKDIGRQVILDGTQLKDELIVESHSTFLPPNSLLQMQFSNETLTVLKRILVGILISFLLVLAVISCLIYLLRIIKNQKQLAEIKNDFISNITHEFKTPIATIGVALEGVKNFNNINNKDKTTQYVDISSEQLFKLNAMVEQLLETASLDADSLNLNIEECNVYALLRALTEKHQLQTHDKTIELISSSQNITAAVDVVYFENALNNLLDNAVKYGGNNIKLTLEESKSGIVISVSDNGTGLLKTEKDKIFDKFYRVPKGNQHDVKGYGIGLYYTRKIIEKHKGLIDLMLSSNVTTFKITIPK
jgi:two-component system phosphate regulon sensor histidine kinase PhoR